MGGGGGGASLVVEGLNCDRFFTAGRRYRRFCKTDFAFCRPVIVSRRDVYHEDSFGAESRGSDVASGVTAGTNPSRGMCSSNLFATGIIKFSL